MHNKEEGTFFWFFSPEFWQVSFQDAEEALLISNSDSSDELFKTELLIKYKSNQWWCYGKYYTI